MRYMVAGMILLILAIIMLLIIKSMKKKKLRKTKVVGGVPDVEIDINDSNEHDLFG